MGYVNIQNGRKESFLGGYFGDLLKYRHLAFNLVSSDLRARFRRSYFGILWAVAQPLAFSLVLGYVWGSLFRYESVWEFALYIFCGMLIWEYFSTNVLVSQEAIIGAEGYLRQARIPFLAFQLRTPMSAMVILWAGCVGLLIFMAALGKLPPLGPHLLQAPAYFALLFLFMAPLSISLSILGVRFRDLRYMSIIAVQALFFVSPVMLGREMLEKPELAFLKLGNPMVPLIDMFRALTIDARMWRMSELVTLGAWIAGLWVVAIVLASTNSRKLVYAL